MLYPFVRLLTLLSCLALLTAGCSKKNDPTNANGTIAGTVTPADAVRNITAVDAGGLTFLAAPHTTTGTFSIADLKPGTYTLRFMPNSGYGAPADRTATVEAGKTTNAGTVAVTGDGTPRGTITWTTGGNSFSSTALEGNIDFSGTNTLIRAVATNGDTTHRVEFYLRQIINAPGTYSLGGGSPLSNEALYEKAKGPVSVFYSTRTVLTGPTTGYSGYGTLVVSSFDGAARTLRATFNYRAATDFYGPTIRYVEVANGTFDLRF